MSPDDSPTTRAPVSACAVAVDVALLTIRDGRLKLLLGEPDTPQLRGWWALPGRRVRDDENLDATAHRALAELAGITAPDAHLEQLRTYGEVSRDPRGRVVSVAYLALTPTTEDPPEHARARLFDVAELEATSWSSLAYDHGRIVPDALERARSKLEYTALATAFVEEPFTLGELRGVYEAVWGVALDPANFRRKVASAKDFVVPASGTAKPGPGGGRPAKLYRRGSAERLHPAMLRP
jgi:8-oxo-dGTP diphosphatase